MHTNAMIPRLHTTAKQKEPATVRKRTWTTEDVGEKVSWSITIQKTFLM